MKLVLEISSPRFDFPAVDYVDSEDVTETLLSRYPEGFSIVSAHKC